MLHESGIVPQATQLQAELDAAAAKMQEVKSALEDSKRLLHVYLNAQKAIVIDLGFVHIGGSIR